jgi:hypothetical protein
VGPDQTQIGSLLLEMMLRRPAARRGFQWLRGFSSQSNAAPELLRGVPLLGAALWRSARNYALLEEWDEMQLLPETLSTWDRHRLFLMLNTPAQFDFDAEQFLGGAKVALEQLLLATKSREFAQFVGGQQIDGAKGDAAERVRAYCTPRGFAFHEELARKALDGQLIVEAEQVDVQSVQLNECVYGQVSDAEFDLELRGKRRVTNVITDQPTLERLFVSVKATVNERLRRELVGEEVQIVEQKNVYFAVLASNVTTPDVVDWAFVANVLASTLRSKEISREKLGAPADSTTESAKQP